MSWQLGSFSFRSSIIQICPSNETVLFSLEPLIQDILYIYLDLFFKGLLHATVNGMKPGTMVILHIAVPGAGCICRMKYKYLPGSPRQSLC